MQVNQRTPMDFPGLWISQQKHVAFSSFLSTEESFNFRWGSAFQTFYQCWKIPSDLSGSWIGPICSCIPLVTGRKLGTRILSGIHRIVGFSTSLYERKQATLEKKQIAKSWSASLEKWDFRLHHAVIVWGEILLLQPHSRWIYTAKLSMRN